MKFKEFKIMIESRFEALAKYELYRTNVDRDLIWSTYLGSFPQGANPIYKERTEHDCNCCKQFIRACGNVVAIVDGELESIWNINIGSHYQVVANVMNTLVTSSSVEDVFLSKEQRLGTDYNLQLVDGNTKRWEHFYFKLPQRFVHREPATAMSSAKSSKQVFKRGLDEISVDAIETVIELIEQKSIYRGEEHADIVAVFHKDKLAYDKLDATHQDLYAWSHSGSYQARIRNTSIGTLLVDISDGVELDRAVRSFEQKVAPQNYKRPKALITQKMIDAAQKEVEELGIGDSLQRRYAVESDITINNVLFASRDVKKVKNVFDELSDEVIVDVKKLKKMEEVTLDTFVSNILPKANKIELLFENKHVNNLMSLLAPEHLDAPSILKWGNNFSWSYNGEVTDSIKERVKAAGGNVSGVLRCSLSWFNLDDLDVHVIEPNNSHICFSNKRSYTSGTLDVDMNAGGHRSRNPVENIVWTDESKMLEGKYKVFVNNYTLREMSDVGFDFEIEYGGVVHTYHYSKRVDGGENVLVAEFEYSKKKGIRFIKSLPSSVSSTDVWNLSTQQFHEVSMIMNSPNYWDDQGVGNKHVFFMLKNCVNDKPSRGFYNEFLKDKLHTHRKVFEVLAGKMKAPPSEHQLSGLGFSTTKKDCFICRVTGKFNRVLKVTI
jgi:hypothetical protein